MKQRKKIVEDNLVGYVDYYELKAGIVFVTEYSLESKDDDFDSEEYINSMFDKKVEIADSANIWGY